MLVVSGQSVIHRNGLVREYLHDSNNYFSYDKSLPVLEAEQVGEGEEAASWLVSVSDIRRNLLRKLVYPPKRKLEDKLEASRQFWNN